ncbi:MAG: 3-hydroxyacyl-CoA dehydrogenase family protein [Candidatus Riflebacteria bacterium]|nr:3-hydroxyacyl-CoA dehydrogenase family protein [Candidatus Riflebacteria bacterium]
MDLFNRLENVSVIGAAGKMGSGIALLVSVLMAKRKLAAGERGKSFRLNLVDVSPAALSGLADYLRAQALKLAEKSIVELRALYADRADLVENGEIVEAFVADVGRVAFLTTELTSVSDSHLVFEAIVEDEKVKLGVYKKLRKMCSDQTFFFTNTSSIPISTLDRKADLEGRLIGYHFYNPPPIQRLVELISHEGTRPDLSALSLELGKLLGKKLIPSNDVAGFIGNGHFIRDGLHAISEVERLTRQGRSFVEAVYAVNRVSQEFMLRPMGIFQLIDYVGIDVFSSILKVMNRYIPRQGLASELVDSFVKKRVLGGQFSSGAQKDGFLKYERNAPAGVYDLQEGKYVAFDRTEPDGWCARADRQLGPLPGGWAPWKKMVSHPKKDEALRAYFQSLWAQDTQGADLARTYLGRSAEISRNLVRDGVARTVEDVNGVLLNGFYHAYGAVSEVVPGSKTGAARTDGEVRS